jgi:hypothetical protein
MSALFDDKSMFTCVRTGTFPDDDGSMVGVVAGVTRVSSVLLNRIDPVDAEAHFDLGVRDTRGGRGNRSEIRVTGRDGRMYAAELDDFRPRS